MVLCCIKASKGEKVKDPKEKYYFYSDIFLEQNILENLQLGKLL